MNKLLRDLYVTINSFNEKGVAVNEFAGCNTAELSNAFKQLDSVGKLRYKEKSCRGMLSCELEF